MIGVVLTGVSLVFDQATIGLMRGGLQLTRNAIFAAAKLLALPVAAIILHDQFGVGIVACWMAGIALSMLLLAIRLRFCWYPCATPARLGCPAPSGQNRVGPQLAEPVHSPYRCR